MDPLWDRSGPSSHGQHSHAPSEESTRALLLLGDEETAEMAESLEATARGHHARLDHVVAFGREDLLAEEFGIEHPSIVEALTTAAQRHLAVWLPFPPDLGHEVTFVGFVSVCAHLGVPLYTGSCISSWHEKLLPGLSTSDAIAVAAVSWRRFLSKACGDLLVTSLSCALADARGV